MSEDIKKVKLERLALLIEGSGTADSLEYRMKEHAEKANADPKSTVWLENVKNCERVMLEIRGLEAEIFEIDERKISLAAEEAKAQRDHEREMAIIANETARENRLAAEAAAKVAATAQEQASQSIDSLLKGLQGNGDS